MIPQGTEGDARARYDKLASDRLDFLDRARSASKLTIPALIVEEGHNKSHRLYQPWQSLGSRGVNNLASKLLLALLPPSQPFFKLITDPFVEEDLKAQGGDQLLTEITRTLAMIERAFLQDLEAVSDRISLNEGLKHLLVAGNVLLYDSDKAGLKVFRLDEYVCKRDNEGTPIEIIIKEELHYETLPLEVVKLLDNREGNRTDEKVDLMTVICRREGRFEVHQEVEGVVIPSSKGEYPEDELPYFPLRMITIDGEDYGRSFVEEYYGDLKSLEGLYKAIVIFAAAASKVIFMVNPNGVTQKGDLAKAESGDIISGTEDDVSVLQSDKFNDFRVAFETAQRIEGRLQQAFMLTSSIQRDAERVTAEEVRIMAQELEESLGGIYSVLTQEFQLRYVKVRLKKLARKNRNWPKLDEKIVKPMIVTGLNALGRGYERDRLLQYLQALTQMLGPEVALQLIKGHEVAERLAIQMGIDTDGLIKTEEETAQEQQAMQEQAMASQAIDKLGPPAMKMMSEGEA